MVLTGAYSFAKIINKYAYCPLGATRKFGGGVAILILAEYTELNFFLQLGKFLVVPKTMINGAKGGGGRKHVLPLP